METKKQFVSTLSKQTIVQLTSSPFTWNEFLELAARMYKYSFPDQVLIFAQRPDATACAELGTWNSLTRRVKAGSKGIALLDERGQFTRLRHVFDITDTTGDASPYFWQLESKYRTSVQHTLGSTYHMPTDDSLPNCIREAVKMVSYTYFQNEQIQDKALRHSISSSTEYCVFLRCGLTPAAPAVAFKEMDIYLVGTAVNTLANDVLRTIEQAVKKENQTQLIAAQGSKEHEQLNLFSAQQYANPRPNPARRAEPTPREIRVITQKLSEKKQENIIQSNDAGGYTKQPLDGSSRNSQQTVGGNDGTIDTKEPAPRQGEQSDGMGSAHELPPAPSRRGDTGRTGIQLTPAPTFTNFHITDDHLGEGGAKTKYKYNANAIRTLQRIEAEHRNATPDEQTDLSKFVGWGGLPQVFDSENTNWLKESTELKDILTASEYAAARASTLNAHYTSPEVIKAIYSAVDGFGFSSGNILEPACGVGNFFGLLPENMAESTLYGVELDSITGRIAKQLYPDADIRVQGFEKADFPDKFFDLVIGNVPFGQYQVSDKKYNYLNFLIHDYFIAKSLDLVRPGGVVAVVTSKGTLDKRSPNVRKHLAQQAELLGAIRLPNTAFQKNAGTQVTADIVFLQKRSDPLQIEPEWVYTGISDDGVAMNSYFVSHPEMILGEMVYSSNMYGSEHDTECVPNKDIELAEQLTKAVQHIQGQITAAVPEILESASSDASIAADPNIKNFSYAIKQDTVYFRDGSRMYAVSLPVLTQQRIRGMVGLRDCTRELIAYQLEGYSEDTIAAKQAELDSLYESFTSKYGLINSTANSRAFAEDSSYYLISSLEIIDENGKLERKADIFTKRTIGQSSPRISVDTASEALSVSMGEKACVDLDFMAELTGFTKEVLIKDLEGIIFRDFGDSHPNEIATAFVRIENYGFVTADEYLSGNVRAKLRLARHLHGSLPPEQAAQLTSNISALEAVQPQDLTASEIGVRLGSTWIDAEYVQEFMYNLLKTPSYIQNSIKVSYSAPTASWHISSKHKTGYGNVLATTTYGTGRINAYNILEDSLNLRDVRVYDTISDPDGTKHRKLNRTQTMLAGQKQEDIQNAFKEWIWEDPQRRQTLVQLYNEQFNSYRPRTYDGQHIRFSGNNPEIKLRSHRLQAIAHILYGGNTLLAHEVGAGKTFEMVAAAMESKRLGLCQKNLFVVPNHLTEQWAAEFLRLYPAANILVSTKKDFETARRKKFCARIATGDYDAIIIGHSQFEKIPISKEREHTFLTNQLESLLYGISQLKQNNGERFTIKELEKQRKSLETKLERLNDTGRKDDIVTFEQLGVDRLFVDEAQSFKNLMIITKMRNVAGISLTQAQKSSDMFMKCRYMDELTDNRGIVFATGTPVSNSMTELYTMQRYLQYDRLQSSSLEFFDAWASTFGETITAIELAPEGTGYRPKTRFAKFYNLPELMGMFKDVADIKTADELDLPTPKANYETISVKPTDYQNTATAFTFSGHTVLK